MIQPRELAQIIGKMVVNGQIIQGEQLANYLQRMPYDDLVSLQRDIVSVHSSEPVFKNCNVCGRTLVRDDELAAGMCAICANEEVPDL